MSFWNFQPLYWMSNFLSAFIIIYLMFGILIFKHRKKIIFNPAYKKNIGWIFIGIIGSMFTANLFYNQSFTQSILTYRNIFLLVTPLLLIKIAPTKKEVIKSLDIFVYIYLIFFIIKNITPSLFYTKNDTYAPDNLGFTLDGYALICIPLFYALQRLKENFTIKNLLSYIFIFAVLFINQNRSTLFPVIIISMWILLQIKSKYKPLIWILCICMFSLFFYYLYESINALIEQTFEELADPDYNRNKAFAYFLYSFSPNIWCTIFGNGFLSANTTSIMANLMSVGIYNSDMGFIGFWNQFGIIPVIVFLYVYISALFNKRVSLYLKLTSLLALTCSLTISYYGSITHMIFFIVFYYLFYQEIPIVVRLKKNKLHIDLSHTQNRTIC